MVHRLRQPTNAEQNPSKIGQGLLSPDLEAHATCSLDLNLTKLSIPSFSHLAFNLRKTPPEDLNLFVSLDSWDKIDTRLLLHRSFRLLLAVSLQKDDMECCIVGRSNQLRR
eukprot:3226778-Rhodomonas_salina.2